MNTRSVMIGLLLSAIGFLGLTAVGCDSNDGEGADAGRVRICNSDDAAYGVEVIHRADYEVVDNFSVSAGSSVAWNCEESGEIEVGAYYLRLYKDNGTFFAKSPDFMVTDKGGDDMATVFITQSGEVGVIDADVGGRGDISVCNLDDESFIVELRADKDGGVVGVFTLHEAGGCDEFQNVETGVYYLQIIGQENRNNTDKSVTFLLEENEVERFEINTSSSILKTTD